MSLSLHHLAPHDDWHNLPEDRHSRGSDTSFRTIHRTPSPCHKSTRSQGSVSSRGLRVRNENVPLDPKASQISLPLSSSSTNAPSRRRISQPATHNASWGNGSPLSNRMQVPPSILHDAGPLYDVDLNTGPTNYPPDRARSSEHGRKQDSANGLSFDIKREEVLSILGPGPVVPGQWRPRPVDPDQKTTATRPLASAVDYRFKGDSLIHRFRSVFGQKRKRTLTVRKERWTLDDFDEDDPTKPDLPGQPPLNGHQKASSWAAFGSIYPTTSPITVTASSTVKNHGHRSSKSSFLRRNRNSRFSNAVNGDSSDSSQASLKAIELAALTRAIQRRQVLEELFTSEKSYVADLKVLLHVYLTILDSGPKSVQAARPEFSRNVGDMLRLHEELVVQVKAKLQSSKAHSHTRPMCSTAFRRGIWHTSDTPDEMDLSIVSEKGASTARQSKEFSWFGRSRKHRLVTTPVEAAEVARLFEHMLERLFVYEEYAARYESMLRNMASLSKTMPNWAAYERGIEALVNSLIPQNSRLEDNRKGLTLEDLLIKPIQRVCRYPLLFAELHRHTPAIDDQQSQEEVEKVLFRLREMAKEINTAANDEKTQAMIQRSWHLQDLLTFPATIQSGFSLRSLGHASLCGVLYVAYQSESEVQGNYMLCALFRSYMLLAQPRPGGSKFEISAIMSRGDLQVEKADSGKGLQCHTAPFSWKVMFEFDQQLYELIFCACTAREEEQWMTTLQRRTSIKKLDNDNWLRNISFEHSALCLDVKSLGPVFGQSGSLMRRQSIQRAATLNSRKEGFQVIIKHTSSTKHREDPPASTTESVGRSQSFLSSYKVPILAPKRADRQRIEQAMASVWTRERLPYPGMAGHRRESLITSATTVMRKLSRASTTTTSTTTSTASVSCSSAAETSTQSGYTAASRIPRTYHSSGHIADQYQTTSSAPGDGGCEGGEDRDSTGISLRNTMTNRKELRTISNGSKAARGSDISGASTLLPAQETFEVEQGRGKLRKPKTLLKHFLQKR